MTAPMARNTYRTIEEFHAARGGDWYELRAMLNETHDRGVKKLGHARLPVFAELYRAVSADLAVSRLRFPRSPVTTELNRLVARAHAVLYRESAGFWQRLGRFMWAGFPEAVRRNRTFVLIGAACLVVPALAGVLWYRLAPASAMDAFGLSGRFNRSQVPLTTLSQSIVDFMQIALNNVRVAMEAFALGVLACVGTVFLLVFNGLLVGVFGAHAVHSHAIRDFFALIVPHGVVELSIIVLAGAAGMRIGWAVISPGRRRRSLAVVDAGRDALKVVVGTIPFFFLAALVEGFLTPAGLSWWVNVTFGIVFGTVFWVYIIIGGRDLRSRSRTTVPYGMPVTAADVPA